MKNLIMGSTFNISCFVLDKQTTWWTRYMKALRIVLNNHISDFETMIRNIMDSMLNRRTICCNFRNLQEFQSKRKRTVFYGFETISYRTPQLWTILPEEFKQRNTISLFKSDVRQWICNECPCRLCKVFVPNLGFIWGTAPNLVLNIHHRFFNACIYIYVFIRLA